MPLKTKPVDELSDRERLKKAFVHLRRQKVSAVLNFESNERLAWDVIDRNHRRDAGGIYVPISELRRAFDRYDQIPQDDWVTALVPAGPENIQPIIEALEKFGLRPQKPDAVPGEGRWRLLIQGHIIGPEPDDQKERYRRMAVRSLDEQFSQLVARIKNSAYRRDEDDLQDAEGKLEALWDVALGR